MAFITGASAIPAIGFNAPPSIIFTDEKKLPEVSTCALTLKLPRNIQNFEDFKETMKTSVLNCQGFGFV